MPGVALLQWPKRPEAHDQHYIRGYQASPPLAPRARCRNDPRGSECWGLRAPVILGPCPGCAGAAGRGLRGYGISTNFQRIRIAAHWNIWISIVISPKGACFPSGKTYKPIRNEFKGLSAPTKEPSRPRLCRDWGSVTKQLHVVYRLTM